MTYEDIIDEITTKYPDLDIAGFDKECRDDPRGDLKDYQKAFEASLRYIDTVKVNKTITSRSPSSYGLKHDVERLNMRAGETIYVPNGVMIAALAWRGVKMKRSDINAITPISPKSRFHE